MSEIAAPVIESADDFRYPHFGATECPFGGFTLLRVHEPVRRVPGRNDYLVTRYEDVRYVLRHPELFSSENAAFSVVGKSGLGVIERSSDSRRRLGIDAPTNLLETDPPAHKAKRQLCFETFKPGRLNMIEGHIYEIVDELIDGFIDRGECNFTSDFARALPTYVTCDMMGIPRSKRELLEEWGAIDPAVPYLPEDVIERQRKVAEEARSFLEESVAERLDNPVEDALSELIQRQIQRDGAPNLHYLMSQAAVLIAGGVITTGHLLGSSMVLLCENPDQMEIVRWDHKKIPRMIEEAMRLESPAQWARRRATRDVELSGTTIPADAIVLALLGSANRDPSQFEDPDAFDVQRSNVNNHVAFGLGAHFCLGAPLARLESRIAFERLFTRLDDIKLSSRSDLTHVESPAFRGPKSVWITFSRASDDR